MVDYTVEIDQLMKELFPICRSITGEGNRETLRRLQELIPLEIKEYPSGLAVYDWVVPKEWKIRDAWIKNSSNEKIVDFSKSNLHVLGYSSSINRKMRLEDLKAHLYYLEELPEAIPYRTCYYKDTWGFCLSYRDFVNHFTDGEEYEVFIDSERYDGSLTIGELLIEGRSKREFLISTYICHPSLANDNLSGVLLTSFLARELMKRKTRFSYRIIFVPETIGAIAYCAMNEEAMRKIDAGFVITTVGGPGKFSYKLSWDSSHYINRVVQKAFHEAGIEPVTYPFDIHGSDERQYSSLGFRINSVSICKDKYYEYPFYHTSLDNLEFTKPECINESLQLYLNAIDIFESNITYENVKTNCEVMLSKHGLYPDVGGSFLPDKTEITELDAILWLLFLCDGKMSLLDIAYKLNCKMEFLYELAVRLTDKNILRKVNNEN